MVSPPLLVATDASNAAFAVLRLIPPEPRRKPRPPRMNNIPSTAEMSEGGYKWRSQKLTPQVTNAISNEVTIKKATFCKLYLFTFLK